MSPRRSLKKYLFSVRKKFWTIPPFNNIEIGREGSCHPARLSGTKFFVRRLFWLHRATTQPNHPFLISRVGEFNQCCILSGHVTEMSQGVIFLFYFISFLFPTGSTPWPFSKQKSCWNLGITGSLLDICSTSPPSSPITPSSLWL